MDIRDACKILAIQGDYNEDIIKKAYRKAAAKYHPDKNPAGLEMMKLVNDAYKTFKDNNFAGHSAIKDDLAAYGDELYTALQTIIHLNVVIEVCGSWVWVSGDTRPHRQLLKDAGYKWAPKKLRWYFRPSDFRSFSRGKFTYEDIQAKYGSAEITNRQQFKIRA